MKTVLPYSNWRDLETQLLWIYEGAPVRMSGRFLDSENSAWLIQRGRLEIEGSEKVFEAGDWVFGPHRGLKRAFSSDARIVSIKFILRWPDGRLLFESSKLYSAKASSYPALKKAAMALLRHIQKSGIESGVFMQSRPLPLGTFLRIDQLFKAWLESYLNVMLDLGASAFLSRREDTRIMKAQRWLDSQPLDKKLDLRRIAQNIGLSSSHADVLFSRTYGQTMRGYFDQRRFNAALHWLERTRCPMKEIAFNLGFKDAAAFSHWFKKHSQLSPSFYRAREQSSIL